MNENELAAKICELLDEKKALNIVKIDLKDLTIIADYFVIASARSTTAVKALANYLDEKLSLLSHPPRRMEGMGEGRWVACDYGTVIVHIFFEETRAFYQLERLWTDGRNVTFIGASD